MYLYMRNNKVTGIFDLHYQLIITLTYNNLMFFILLGYNQGKYVYMSTHSYMHM